MKIRFQADADLNDDIVKGLFRRESGVDFRTATDARLRGLSDLKVLELAAADNRVLVSHDRKTMPGAFAQFVRSHDSPGVIIISQKLDLLAAIDALLLIWSASEAEEWKNRIASVPL